jgi:hypothetical protein
MPARDMYHKMKNIEFFTHEVMPYLREEFP